MRRLCWPAGGLLIAWGALEALSTLLLAALGLWFHYSLRDIDESINQEPMTYLDALEGMGEEQGDWIFFLITDAIVMAVLVLLGLILLKLPKWIETRGGTDG